MNQPLNLQRQQVLPQASSIRHLGYLRLAALLLVVLVAISACQSTPTAEASPPGDTVQQAINAFVEGFNNQSLTDFDTYFATLDQGADADGLLQTQEAAHALLHITVGSDTVVEVHSFEITGTKIDNQNHQAVVHYKADISIVYNSDLSDFAGIVEQDVALQQVDGKWLITGGDQPQITPVESSTPEGG
ncbi:MAG: hypothetical protein H6672_16450 [Anaerolineaceae bacterium]|nr:hypothetical protein [Anaerolineaceae bacterium]